MNIVSLHKVTNSFSKSFLGVLFLMLMFSCSNGTSDNTSQTNNDSLRTSYIQDSPETTKREAVEERVRLIEQARKDSLDHVQDSINAIKVVNLIKKFRVSKDDFSSKTWYEHNNSPRYRNSNGFYFYFAIDENIGVGPLRMVLQYYYDDWLFIKNMIFSIDGEAYFFSPEDMKRDNKGGYIWKWFDESIDYQSDLVQALINANSVKIKLNGSDYYDTRTLSSKQLIALKETFELYDLFKN